MRPSVARVLAAITLLSALGQLALLATGPRAAAAGEFGFPGFQVIFAVAYVVVGYLIAARRPAIPIGWTLLVAGVAAAGAAHEYALRSAHGDPLPGADPSSWAPSSARVSRATPSGGSS